MDIYFGTVVRGAPIREGGALHRLDWESRKIVASQPIFPENPSLDDPNPRGSTRGCRGIVLSGGKVFAAGYHTVGVFDPELRPLGSFSHGLMAGLHEMSPSAPGCAWIASTTLDAALEFELETGRLLRELWPREMPAFQNVLRTQPLALDKSLDQRAALVGTSFKDASHLHLNAVAQWRDEVYALLPTRGCIANLSAGRIVVHDRDLRGAHNLVVRPEDGVVFVNDTVGHMVRLYDLRSGKLVRKLEIARTKAVRGLEQGNPSAAPAPELARPLFLRGLALDGSRVFVGLSPATILCFDWERGTVLGAFQMTNDVRVCVHGLAVRG